MSNPGSDQKPTIVNGNAVLTNTSNPSITAVVSNPILPTLEQGSSSTSNAEAGPSDPGTLAKTNGRTVGEHLSILNGDKIFLSDQQFPGGVRESLTKLVQHLGADLVESKSKCNIVLDNPLSVDGPKQRGERAKLRRDYPGIPQPIILPYHWLTACLAHESRLPTDGSANISPLPIIFHPDRSMDHSPLRIWVSVNVNRKGDEAEAYHAQANVQNALLERGAIITDRRGNADILVVDRTSKFYRNTVLKERERHDRRWQRIVERDWVDDIISSDKMAWPPMEENDEEADSMAEEEPPSKGRGPGRPTGKPRVDYTPEDGDFLCRYLAAYSPQGSWRSRKTFETMAEQHSSLFPIIDRHPPQSWHEHFKKNATTYERRLQAYIRAGVDGNLRTDAERAALEQKKLEEERAALLAHEERNQAAAAATVVETEDREAGPSSSSKDGGLQPTVAEREGARLTEMAAQAVSNSETRSEPHNQAAVEQMAAPPTKKRLVELDSDDEDSQRVPSGHAAANAEHVTGEPPVDIPLGNRGAETIVVRTTTSEATLTASAAALEPEQVTTETIAPTTDPVKPAGPDVKDEQHATPVNGIHEKRPGAEEVSTPTVSAVKAARRSLLQETIRSSEKKRRSALDRAVYRGHTPSQRERQGPDMVYTSINIAPHVPYAPSSRSVTPSNPPRRPPSPPLTAQQREERVVSGHELVRAIQQEYRTRMLAFAEKYRIKPSAVIQVMDELKGGTLGGGQAGGSVYWDTVGEALRAKFGY